MATGPWSGRQLHFVGIGGAGMSGLALVAMQLGAVVTGSDRAEDSPTLGRLRAAGARPAVGHAADNVPPLAELVFSTAVAPDNAERAVARERGQRELHRAQLLGELTRMRPTIAVAGTHGKTTTSSMIVHALRAVGADPAFLVGGTVRSADTNAHWGEGGWLVVEADESDRSLLGLDRTVAVLTNAELDHLETYTSREQIDLVFAEFCSGAADIVVWDRPELLAICARATEEGGGAGAGGPQVHRYDVPAPGLVDGGSTFVLDGVPVRLQVPGAHNALNAAAALTACALTGADPAATAAALADFTGAGRRFERLGSTAAGALVVDDYAHHPTEVRATLEAARTLGADRVVAVLQPHLFSRTAHHADAFGAALALADLALVLPIYPARESAEAFPGVTSGLVVEAARAAGARVEGAASFADARDRLLTELRPGDVCLVLGAGDVDRLGRELVAAAPTA